MIAIIDYKMGNLRSVKNALSKLGAEYTVTDDPAAIIAADKVLLPGVGYAAQAMANLRERGLVEVIRGLRQPVLGICIGMQVLCRYSEEGDTPCLDVFDTDVRLFKAQEGLKVPHMGWNSISNLDSKLFKGVDEGSYVYFVHSYRPGLCQDTIATSNHGGLFSAALKYENFYGTQFHPEKSGDVGEKILSNFLAL
ncbi:MAG: imidazole glycerol phosphate synthase subunit HisH [Bacteroidales bacterium]|nr:imidazole glycerol phosphate synthase subunit HisH [Bacteroidales bacterium]MBR5431004.1 imidazole glycerol phosphate synthase subunit HisH [Bacteroidales bacterium]